MIQKLHQRMKLSKPSRISLDILSTGPGPFTMSYGFDPEPLKASIKTVGLLNPPLLLESRAGHLAIVSGHRRMTALFELGEKEAPARILQEHDISYLDALFINFFDNLATREFNSVEKGMILRRLANYLPANEILSEYMALLSLPRRHSILKTYISFDRDLDETLKFSLARGAISEATATALLELVPDERKAVGSLLLNLKLNMNQQRQLFELLYDISNMNEASVSEILHAKPVLDILSNDSLNRPQKTKTLLTLLRSRRFPRLTRAEEVFRKGIARLRLPKKVSIQAPPYFETEFYRMEISFRNGKELIEVIDHLAHIEELGEIKNPWETSN
jgi:ParB-like chromosome segregation protein Spo0J